MKSAVVTGAAGFVGYYVVKTLSEHGYKVHAIVRPESEHNERIKGINNVVLAEYDIASEVDIQQVISDKCDIFINLVWVEAGRYDYEGQMKGVFYALNMLENAKKLGCRRYIGIGSQAEYGIQNDIIYEDSTSLKPYCAYGIAKIAACYLTKKRAEELGMEWVWGRIFSVYGKYEPANRIIPYTMRTLLKGEKAVVSSCNQFWDFIYGTDVGEALLAVAERGRTGEIYNIADGRYRILKEFVETVVEVVGDNNSVVFGDDANPFVSLKPSVEKIKMDTGWEPRVTFLEGIKDLTKGVEDVDS